MNEKVTEMWQGLKGKKVILYGADASGLAFLYEARKRGIPVSFFADRDESKQGKELLGVPIKAPLELMYEEPDDLKIVVTAPGGMIAIKKALEDMGFDERQIVMTYAEGRGNADYLDVMLGISRGNHTLVSMKPQATAGAKKVLAIGGSTTDPYWDGIHSWPYYLQKKFDEQGIEVEIINAGVMGYTSSQELLLLLRDGIELHPDLVISFSGYNDYTPSINVSGNKRYRYTSRNLYITWNRFLKEQKGEEFQKVYFGEERTDLFDIYLQNVRLMHGVCCEFNIRFLSIFQPCIISTEPSPGGFVEEVMEEDFVGNLKECWRDFYERFQRIEEKYPYLFDFSRIFDGRDEVLVDLAHVTEEGNQIIADRMFELICDEKAL